MLSAGVCACVCGGGGGGAGGGVLTSASTVPHHGTAAGRAHEAVARAALPIVLES